MLAENTNWSQSILENEKLPQPFASRYQIIQLFDQLEDFESTQLWWIYVAVVKLHFVQAKTALSASKASFLKSRHNSATKNG